MLGLGYRLSLRLAGAANALGFIDAYALLRRRLAKWSVCIMSYHRVGDYCEFPTDVPLTTPQDFEKQVVFLRRRYQPMSLAQLGDAIQRGTSIPPNAAVITFDDGYRDNYLYAYPILKKYGVPATIFLATGHVDHGTPFWWDRVSYAIHNSASENLETSQLGAHDLKSAADRWQASRVIDTRLKQLLDRQKNLAIEELVRQLGVDLPKTMAREMILTWDEVREMARNGISFGSHTVNHPTLIGLPLEETRKEIVDSKRRIEENVDQPVNTFAYPDGRLANISDGIKAILRENGFVCAVYATPNRLVSPGTDPYGLGRISPKWDFATFNLSVSGLYPDLNAVIGRLRRR
jgi:peptidoglycan/xylan/chitin deacetylase (PgdA/CDA1 family)